MNICKKILNSMNRKIKIFLSFALIFFLSSCGECETVQDYFDKGTGDYCFFCPLYITLTNAGSYAAKISWDIVAKAAQPVVCIVIAIYIAFYTLKMVASMGQQSFADYLSADKKGVLFLSFKSAVIVLLLSSENFLAEYVIAPLLQASAGVGIQLASSMINEDFVTIPNLENKVTPWDDLFGLMNKIALGFNDVAYIVVAIGKALVCNSTAGIIFKWKLLMLIYGLIVLLFGWMVCIGVCYFLVDVIINLICAAVLLPIGIALAISDKTMNHSKNIWNLFVNSFCSCLFLGIVLSLAIAILDLNMGENTIDALISGVNINDINGTSDSMTNLVAENNISALNTYLKESGSLILMIVSLTLLVKMVESIKNLAKQLSSTSGLTDAGSKTLTPLTKKAMGEGMRLAKGVGKNVGHVAVRATHLDELSTWGKNKIQAARGFLTGTGSQSYRAFWRRRP